MRFTVAVLAAMLTAGSLGVAVPAAADDTTECNYPSCTPGIVPGVVLGSYCDNPTYYAFGVTS